MSIDCQVAGAKKGNEETEETEETGKRNRSKRKMLQSAAPRQQLYLSKVIAPGFESRGVQWLVSSDCGKRKQKLRHQSP